MDDFDAPCIDRRQLPMVIDWALEFYSGTRSRAERKFLLDSMVLHWAAFEVRMMQYPKASIRQAYLVLEELVVEEERKLFADLDARRHFTPEGEKVQESRSHVEDLLAEAIAEEKQAEELQPDDLDRRAFQTASKLQTGFEQHGLVEIG